MKQEYPTKPNAAAQTRETGVTDIAAVPAPIIAWLHAEHEQLANALAQVHSELELTTDGEAMLCVEELPEATRKFLWRGMQRYHPALRELVRDPIVREARATFGARLHLRVSDLVQVICAAGRRATQGGVGRGSDTDRNATADTDAPRHGADDL